MYTLRIEVSRLAMRRQTQNGSKLAAMKGPAAEAELPLAERKQCGYPGARDGRETSARENSSEIQNGKGLRSMRNGMTCLAIFVIALALFTGALGCGDSNVETVDRNDSASQQTAGQSDREPAHETDGATGAASGITWNVPSAWEVGPARQMRVATYLVGGNTSNTDCAVFYFGPGQGGAVQANIDRWIGQFVQPDGSSSSEAAALAEHEFGGLRVTTIDLTGTYTASMGGPMSGQKEERPNWRMLGAIVEAPQGPVFFKLTGPEETVETATNDFQQMLTSLREG
jgi:hypothetical protein